MIPYSAQVRNNGLERELIWNNGEGLNRDSPIMQNASRARVIVDAQGRRRLSMSGLGERVGTATGNLSYR